MVVAATGFFDGVHKGHQKVLSLLRDIAPGGDRMRFFHLHMAQATRDTADSIPRKR